MKKYIIVPLCLFTSLTSFSVFASSDSVIDGVIVIDENKSDIENKGSISRHIINNVGLYNGFFGSLPVKSATCSCSHHTMDKYIENKGSVNPLINNIMIGIQNDRQEGAVVDLQNIQD